MFSQKWIKCGVMIFGMFFFLTYVLELDAYGRVGSGRSSGSRGSRSFTAPKPQAAQPAAQARQAAPVSPSSPMAAPQSGGFMRGMGGALLGGLAGGIIGGMLFRSLGFSGDGTGGGGIGIFEIVLIGLLLYGIWWYLKRRRQEAAATAGAAHYREASTPQAGAPVFTPNYAQQPMENDLDTNLGYIRQMDPSFNQQKFKDQCTDTFFRIQGAWANRDMSVARNLLTDEMYRVIQGDADELRRNGRINRLENIAVRNIEISEAWQEEGNDYITVHIVANVLDYTIDEKSGQIVTGSKTEPVKFEEYWTFTRPVGNNPWQMSAINQVS